MLPRVWHFSRLGPYVRLYWSNVWEWQSEGLAHASILFSEVTVCLN
jgi:hypothetical protein